MGPGYALTVSQDEHISQEMRPKVSAQLVAVSTMLELTGMALQETIERELVDNPALEADEVTVCDVCGTPLQGSICPTCLRLQTQDLPEDIDDRYDGVDERILASAEDDDYDPILATADREPLTERLIRELAASVPSRDRAIAEQLVYSLDERGYLDCSPEEIADNLGVELGRVEAVLTALQTLEPVGVGARDLRECMLIQLEHLESQGVDVRIARAIVSDHMADLAAHRYDRIARLLKVKTDDVLESVRLIRERLNPFPAQAHDGPAPVADARSQYRLPDVAILEVDGRFVVEVVEARRLELRVAGVYEQMSRQAGLAAEEQAHVRQYVSRAKLFIRNIAQRRQTIKKITEAIVAEQTEFLRSGIRQLRPLTKSHIAQKVELDESTVSRATNGKNVLLPNGQVVSFDTFFTPMLAVQDVIREIIDQAGRPMTDAEIRDALAARGIDIARRTVAKYRLRAGIAAATQRADHLRLVVAA
jgi:RNA polymerase sigma-54 factor